MVIAVVAVLCILGGVFFWRKRQRRGKFGDEPYKPTGGRYELGTDKADAPGHRLEAEGLGVQEMEVPPVEAGEGGVHELSAEPRPVEIGNTYRHSMTGFSFPLSLVLQHLSRPLPRM